MTNIIRISDLKRITGLSNGVEDRKCEPFVPAAQLTLRDILGTDGYNALVAAVEADYAITDTDLRTLRDDYVWPYLAWRTLELSGTRLWVEPQRAGTFERSGETFTSASQGQIGLSKVDARDMAKIYQAELVRFLDENAATYTWWKVDACKPGTPNYTGGVITEKPIRPPFNWYDRGY